MVPIENATIKWRPMCRYMGYQRIRDQLDKGLAWSSLSNLNILDNYSPNLWFSKASRK